MEYMKEIMRAGKEEKERREALNEEGDEDEELGEEKEGATPPLATAGNGQTLKAAKEEPTEKEIYDKALRALEAKKRELLEKKRAAAAAAAAAAEEQEEEEEVQEVKEIEEVVKAVTPAAAATSAEEQPAQDDSTDFQPSPTFAGARQGYVFKLGVRGQGYYSEGPVQGSAEVRPQFIDKSAEEVVMVVGGEQAQVAPVAGTGASAADLDELD